MTFEGIIKFIGQEQTVGQNNIPKITFMLEENVEKEFKSSIAVDLMGEKTNLIKDYKVWDKVKVSLNFRANDYEGKWYNRVTAWRLEALGASSSGSKSEKQNDDLPF